MIANNQHGAIILSLYSIIKIMTSPVNATNDIIVLTASSIKTAMHASVTDDLAPSHHSVLATVGAVAW